MLRLADGRLLESLHHLTAKARYEAPLNMKTGLPIRDTGHHTYGEYLTWPEAQRYELIEGVAYAMSPAPTRLHQQFVIHIARQIADALEGTPCEVNIAPFDVRMPEADEVDEDIRTVVQPDILVVCDRTKLDERGCRGAPDWVIEIVSPATAGHDQIKKLEIYEHHGVKEYWIVHPTDRIVTVYRLGAAGYGRPRVLELTGRLEATTPPVSVDWEAVMRHVTP